ncbi:hypothetical protein FNL55_20950 [Tardiphaga sp. vice352]|uniref:LuxR C-terminal-related transcriptional regulator n=1 Tax=unclassified Tardiphaga TaxID=2631404 RepID=UPI0011628511|nr:MULTISPECIES: LuxR C-terminal-related transcriptional regulator [unclassified Tardiphaga]QDM18206.1 hypothetical protein FNL53_21460 [Tardiphaga sp. vice278]QDM23212.1 hypothetical protein FIU28_20265 [Tardiphaga sp. vice154]QDM33530.1 hypothetical protein FNL55_20950 [Tardiphaga sp. vice352]
MRTMSAKLTAATNWTDNGATFGKLNSLPVSIAILDAAGTIVVVNDAWKKSGRQNGLRLPDSAIGSNYLQYCQSDERDSCFLESELRALLAGQREYLTYLYPCHSPTEARWFCLMGIPLSPHGPAAVALLHVNLSAIFSATIGKRREHQKREKGQAHARFGLAAIGDVLDRSVLETLPSQLKAMPAVLGIGEKSETQWDADQVVRAQLSKRQMEVLRLLGEGKSNKEIAMMLFLSPNTIKLHVSAILDRLKLKSRTQAALLSSRLARP